MWIHRKDGAKSRLKYVAAFAPSRKSVIKIRWVNFSWKKILEQHQIKKVSPEWFLCARSWRMNARAILRWPRFRAIIGFSLYLDIYFHKACKNIMTLWLLPFCRLDRTGQESPQLLDVARGHASCARGRSLFTSALILEGIALKRIPCDAGGGRDVPKAPFHFRCSLENVWTVSWVNSSGTSSPYCLPPSACIPFVFRSSR